MLAIFTTGNQKKWVFGGVFVYKLSGFWRIWAVLVGFVAKIRVDCSVVVAKWLKNYPVGTKCCVQTRKFTTEIWKIGISVVKK